MEYREVLCCSLLRLISTNQLTMQFNRKFHICHIITNCHSASDGGNICCFLACVNSTVRLVYNEKKNSHGINRGCITFHRCCILKRNYPVCIALAKVAKASTFTDIFARSFDNLNTTFQAQLTLQIHQLYKRNITKSKMHSKCINAWLQFVPGLAGNSRMNKVKQ